VHYLHQQREGFERLRRFHNVFGDTPGSGCNKGVTPLYALLFHGYHGLAKTILFEEQIDVNAPGGPYGSALQAASYRGHGRAVEMLLEHRADVNAQGGNNGTALKAASPKGHDRIVGVLLSKGADVNTQGGAYGNALYDASTEGHERIARILLENRADVNAKVGADSSALRAASASGHQRIIQVLIRAGSNDVELEQRLAEDFSSRKSDEKKVSFIDLIVGLGHSTSVPSEYTSLSSEDVDDDVFSHNPESSHPTTITDPSIGRG